jgi:Protein of unknown function (DUF2950)
MEGNTMPECESVVVQLLKKNLLLIVLSILFVLFLVLSAQPTVAQQSGQKTFGSVEDAAHAFFVASHTESSNELLNILGPAGKEIISSGDAVEDSAARVGFIAKYEEMHRFVTEPSGNVTLIIGAENWPFPIPLVQKNGVWYFDTQAGKNEILFRRIDKNELAAIQASRELVDGEKQYFQHAPHGFANEYAQKLDSDNGRHNGLYWVETSDEFKSPINPLIASAHGKGPNEETGEQYPFNGYFFRILTTQGPHAPGGAKNYVVDGKMTAGFAFVAYPAKYRSSGVKTFIVSASGIIYEKDLGADTTKLAEAMTVYDPDSTWHKVQ